MRVNARIMPNRKCVASSEAGAIILLTLSPPPLARIVHITEQTEMDRMLRWSMTSSKVCIHLCWFYEQPKAGPEV